MKHGRLWAFCCCLASKSCLTLLQPHELLQLTSFLCPWDFPGKNTEVGYNFLLQGIFLTQELNPCVLHCRWILYCWADSLLLPFTREDLLLKYEAQNRIQSSKCCLISSEYHGLIIPHDWNIQFLMIQRKLHRLLGLILKLFKKEICILNGSV